MEENLRKARKDKQWLRSILDGQAATLEQTWLLTVDGGNHVSFFRKEC